MKEKRRKERQSKLKKVNIKNISFVSVLITVAIVLCISGTLAYFTHAVSITNSFTIKDSHTITYNYYVVDENDNVTSLQDSKSKTYFDDTVITLGEDTEYFIDDDETYQSVTYKIDNTEYTTPTYTVSNKNVTIDQYYYLTRYTITYDLDGGTLSTSNPTTYTENTATFTLNNPTKTGYTFRGWNSGKNLLDYDNLTDYAKSSNGKSDITVDENGYISDSTPTVDSRGFVYNSSNWQLSLPAGTYTLSLEFKTKATNSAASSYSQIVVMDSNNTNIFNSRGLCFI